MPRRCRAKDSTFPDDPGKGLATTPSGRRPSSAASTSGRGLGAKSRIAHDAAGAQSFFPDLELRLHHRHQVAVWPERRR